MSRCMKVCELGRIERFPHRPWFLRWAKRKQSNLCAPRASAVNLRRPFSVDDNWNGLNEDLHIAE
jgi:hypothetical protein